MIEKKKLLTSDWKSVENYLHRDSQDSIKLAIIEAEKVFLKSSTFQYRQGIYG